jgi:deoxyribonuclease IV
MVLGAHISVAGGLYKAFERAQAVGCETMQIFTKSERQWNAKPITEEDLELWHSTKATAGLAPLITHDSYLINLASPTEELWEKSISAFEHEIERNEMLAIPYLVTHVGAHMGSGEETACDKVATAINRIHKNWDKPKAMILFETTAGQGTAIGYKFEHWGRIFEQLEHPDWVGICFDTCHVFASGYDLTTPEAYQETMQTFDRSIGITKIKAFHMNDSKKGLFSRVDRHEAIGQGALGLEPFRLIMNDPRFKDTPKILETPKSPDSHEDVENLATLRSLITTAT